MQSHGIKHQLVPDVQMYFTYMITADLRGRPFLLVYCWLLDLVFEAAQ